MTHEEALAELESRISRAEHFGRCYVDNIDIDKLRMAKEALEKQIPRKAIKHKELGWEKACPDCERIMIGIPDYCEYCGRALDWSEK